MSGHGRSISVVGLGYVGLPVAVAFARSGVDVVAFDIDAARIAALGAGCDTTGEVDADTLAAAAPRLKLTADPAALAAADFHIVTVPTPIDADKRPDLGPLRAASATVGRVLRPGAVVVFESTVYPGATEEVCAPILARESGLRAGRDFTLGYSPERINPGDRAHRFESIDKVIAAQDPDTLALMAEVYGSAVRAGLHRAPNIATAEAAKAIENTQRDINIALMNELALICDRLGLDTGDVLAAAGSKWNFLPFTPGLVGGHCIGVDPYYLTHKAQAVGYDPKVILAGRAINDQMGAEIARRVVKALLRQGSGPAPVVTVLGVTFKENVPDIRNSKVVDLIAELTDFGVRVQIHDPLADPAAVRAQYGLELSAPAALAPADAVVVAVPHDRFRQAGWGLVRGLLADGGGFVADLRAMLDRAERPDGVTLWRL